MTRLLALLTHRAGLIFAALLVIVVALAWCAGRESERDARAVRDLKTEAAAGRDRETAAIERADDTAAVAAKLETWNHDAERTPDAAPDQRELRRRCRQLREAGRDGLAACRGLEG